VSIFVEKSKATALLKIMV